MIDLRYKEDTSDLEAIRRFGFDIDDMNRNIRSYRPTVGKVEKDASGISVRIDDANGNVPSFWEDYYMSRGDLASELNKMMFNTRDREDMELSIYINDEDVREAAGDAAFEYLYDRGYIENTPSGYRITDKPVRAMNVRRKGEPVKRRRMFGLRKKVRR